MILLSCLPRATQAAQPQCKSYYTVYATDTLRKVSQKTGVSPYDIMRANKKMMLKPNYSIFLGTKLCIPNPTSDKTFPAWVLDQPVATFYPRVEGKKVIVAAVNFPLGSNWTVRAGDKLGKIKVLKKAAWSKTFPYSGQSQICLKNHTTDFLYCRKAIK